MRLVLQRVTRASVTVDGGVVGSIGAGLLVLVGISATDDASAIEWATRRILGIRLWEESGKAWSKSVTALGLEVLLVSQFTLYCALKGHKPDFHNAMPPAPAREFWTSFVQAVSAAHKGKVQQGQFGAKMLVDLVNDGPVTIELEHPAPAAPTPSAPPSATGSSEPPKAAPLLLLLRALEGSYGFAGLRECEQRGLRVVGAKTVADDVGAKAMAVLLSGGSAATVKRIMERGADAFSVHEGEEAIERFFGRDERFG